MRKEKTLKAVLFITDIFFISLIVLSVFLPNLVTWYVEIKGRSESLATIIFVTCYPCAPFAGIILWSLRKLIKEALEEKFFEKRSIELIKRISICCIMVSVITLISGLFYLPFLIVGLTFAFLSLLMFALKTILEGLTKN